MNKGLMLAAFAVLLLGTAFADVVGADPTPDTTGKYPVQDAGNYTTEGGNVTNIDLGVNASTEKWAAFYGNITGNLLLQQGTTPNAVYVWDWTPDSGGFVCVAETSGFAWGSVVETTALAIDGAWSFGAAIDNATNTFNETESFTIGGETVTATASVIDDQAWETAAVTDTVDFGFCVAINNGGTLAVGGTGDYQMMVATPEAPDSYQLYYFFVELI